MVTRSICGVRGRNPPQMLLECQNGNLPNFQIWVYTEIETTFNNSDRFFESLKMIKL